MRMTPILAGSVWVTRSAKHKGHELRVVKFNGRSVAVECAKRQVSRAHKGRLYHQPVDKFLLMNARVK